MGSPTIRQPMLSPKPGSIGRSSLLAATAETADARLISEAALVSSGPNASCMPMSSCRGASCGSSAVSAQAERAATIFPEDHKQRQ
eukprot:3067127-Prymnesium_polylepis.1